MEDRFFHCLHLAARGELDAMRTLREAGLIVGSRCDDVLGWCEALTFARLAAARGERDDEVRLVGILGQFAEAGADTANPFAAEAVARLERLAETGEPLANDAGLNVAQMLDPATMQEAQRIHQELKSVSRRRERT